jgi:protease I
LIKEDFMEGENVVLFVLANQDFKDEEYQDTKAVLDEAGMTSKVAAISNEDCKGTTGSTVSVDYTFDEINTSEFIAIIYIGGTGAEKYIHSSGAHALAKMFLEAGKVVAAICWAPAILANAGILKEKEATVWEGAKDELTTNGAHYTAEAVTVDGNIITADGPDSATEFGQKIVAMLTG